MRLRYIPAALLGLAIGYTGTIDINLQSSGIYISPNFGVNEADARPARRMARRTSRRVTRRTVVRSNHRYRVYNRRSIAGCNLYNAYYNCGGVYYRGVVQNGATVYIVVNP
jgi:hypothetical protein